MNRIGIDLGGTKIEGVVIEAGNKILIRRRVATPQQQGYAAILRTVTKLALKLEGETTTACRIGIGTPGTISARTGLLRNSNTRCLNGQPLHNDLEQHLDREVRIANDANCFALSEAVNGAAKGYDSVFGIIMGTGVGGGIVMRDSVHKGAMHIAGEWGHNELHANGASCYCGRNGCVETYLSGPGFSADHARSGGTDDLQPEDIIALAQSGDHIACLSLARFLANFGRSVATVINILDPDAIVLGGGMSNIELLYTDGPDAIAPHIFSDYFSTPILRNAHGDSSGVLGAAQLWHTEELS